MGCLSNTFENPIIIMEVLATLLSQLHLLWPSPVLVVSALAAWAALATIAALVSAATFVPECENRSFHGEHRIAFVVLAIWLLAWPFWTHSHPCVRYGLATYAFLVVLKLAENCLLDTLPCEQLRKNRSLFVLYVVSPVSPQWHRVSVHEQDRNYVKEVACVCDDKRWRMFARTAAIVVARALVLVLVLSMEHVQIYEISKQWPFWTILLIYCVLSLAMDFNALLLIGIFGYLPYSSFQSPFAASSCTDFWRRWNRAVGAPLHRSCFKLLLRRQHFSPSMAAFLTFALSGIFHEYCVLAAYGLSGAGPYLGHSFVFFLASSTWCTAEAVLHMCVELPHKLAVALTLSGMVVWPPISLFTIPFRQSGFFVDATDLWPIVVMR
jgi:hypothetical protein